MATVDVKYLTQPHDGTPGTPWDDFEERILGVASGKTDDRGWSIADTLNGVDEGSAGGPPIPGGAVGVKAHAQRLDMLAPERLSLLGYELGGRQPSKA